MKDALVAAVLSAGGELRKRRRLELRVAEPHLDVAGALQQPLVQRPRRLPLPLARLHVDVRLPQHLVRGQRAQIGICSMIRTRDSGVQRECRLASRLAASATHNEGPVLPQASPGLVS